MATLAWFLAAARTIDGPPMSISSISSSTVIPGRSSGGRERVQVDDDELERGDRGGEQLAPMVVEAAVGQDAAVDPRMERLDPPVEHLREPGHGGHVGDRQAGVAQRPGRAAGRDELEAAARPGPRPSSTSPVLSETDSSARRGRGTRRVGAVEIERHAPAVRRDRERAGQEQRDGPRQQPVLDGADPVVEASPRRRRAGSATASWATIGPPSSVSSTRWTVQPVTVTPCASASATAWAPGNAGRSDGCVLRIRPANAASTAGPDDPHVARQDDDVGPDRGRASSASVASSPPGTSAVSIPCSAAQSSAGHARSAKTRTIVAAELAARRRRGQRPQVRARRPTRRPRSGRRRSPRRSSERSLDVARAADARRVDDLADDHRRDRRAAASAVDRGRDRGRRQRRRPSRARR